MLKSAAMTLAGIGLAALAAADTLAVQRTRERLEDEGRAPLSARPEAAGLRARLRSEPLEPGALRDLGLLDPGGGRGLLHLAERVSRQEPATQVILLQSAALGGDLDETLAHYDVLLSTRPQATPMLQAQLAAGLQNPQIADRVAHYAGRRWFFDFLLGAASAGDADPRPVARLAQATGQLAEADERLTPRLLSALLRKGYPADAFRLAHAVTARGGDWAQFPWTAASTSPRLAPLTWTLADGAQAHAAFAGSGAISVTIDPLTSAQVVRRVTDLPPGAYALTQRVSAPNPPAPALEWRMACVTGQPLQPAWRSQIAVVGGASEIASEVTIAPGCPYQEWSLRAVGADTQTASSATIEGLGLRRR